MTLLSRLPRLAAPALAALLAAGMAVSAAGLPAAPRSETGAIQQVKTAPAEVVLLRGFGDIFSRGLDAIAAKLAAGGIPVTLAGHNSWRRIERQIVERRRNGARGRIVLIGHSLGANAITAMAADLAREGIPVDLLVSLAATNPKPVAANVRSAVNFYFSTGGWGEPLVAAKNFRGRLRNRDFARIAGVGHFNIEKQATVQAEVVAAVRAALGR